jgi:hypothetical protein
MSICLGSRQGTFRLAISRAPAQAGNPGRAVTIATGELRSDPAGRRRPSALDTARSAGRRRLHGNSDHDTCGRDITGHGGVVGTTLRLRA